VFDDICGSWNEELKEEKYENLIKGIICSEFGITKFGQRNSQVSSSNSQASQTSNSQASQTSNFEMQ
jgi:hypothetical protein